MKEKMRKIILGMALFMLSNVSVACYKPPIKLTDLNNQPIVRVMSQNGKFLLEMHPAKWSGEKPNFIKLKESLGIVYSVAEDGLMSALWKMKGIYPRRYQPMKNPLHYESLTHYLSNSGNKIISILDKGFRSKALITVFDRSGTIKIETNERLKGKKIWGCGMVFFQSHTTTPEGNIELKTHGVSRLSAKEWLLSMDSGELKRIH